MPAGADSAKVLVTGASGMLGLALCERFGARYRVTGVSKSGRQGTQACDLAQPEAVERLLKIERPDLVIHSAAYSSVDGCEADPVLARASNALSTQYLAKACGASGRAFIYISTDYVFDGQKRSPYVESDPTGPVNIYGLTKLEGEYYASGCASPSAIVRTSWLFGDGNPNTFVSAILRRFQTEKKISVLEDQVDSPTYVRDLAEALELLAQNLLAKAKVGGASTEIFHLCNQGETTRHAMTLQIKDYLRQSSVEVTIARPSDISGRLAVRPAYGAMSSSKFEKCFGKKMRPWQEALEEYVGSI